MPYTPFGHEYISFVQDLYEISRVNETKEFRFSNDHSTCHKLNYKKAYAFALRSTKIHCWQEGIHVGIIFNRHDYQFKHISWEKLKKRKEA